MGMPILILSVFTFAAFGQELVLNGLPSRPGPVTAATTGGPEGLCPGSTS